MAISSDAINSWQFYHTAMTSKIVVISPIWLYKIVDNLIIRPWHPNELTFFLYGFTKSLTILLYNFNLNKIIDKLVLRLWKPKIIDNSLVWLSHKEKFKKWSWQFDYTAVTNHWQFSCMAVCLKIWLTTLLHSFENCWQ